MKTIILYASKHGATAEIARRIAARLPDAAVCDLRKDAVPPINDFDCVILGSPLLAGTIRKEVKDFLSQRSSGLAGKKLGLFLSGIGTEGDQKYFESNFTPDILRTASAKSFLGGIFDPAKAGFMERLMIKAAAKHTEYFNNIMDDKINEFAEALKS